MLEAMRRWFADKQEGKVKLTHYVVFLVDDVAYSTNDMPKDVADQIAIGLGGIAMPIELRDSGDEPTLDA
jgi:hypothetical protein